NRTRPHGQSRTHKLAYNPTPAVGHTKVTLINTKATGIQNGYDAITQPVETIDTTQGTITTILEPTQR
uniref:hypothetical protein n=1 Tax=uncultured Bifidobacterium sp. TaxID=165187 RepID=UPI002593BF90